MKSYLLLIVAFCLSLSLSLTAQTIEKVAPGVWKVTYGTPEKFKPSDFKEDPALDALAKMSGNEKPPFDLSTIKFKTTSRGCVAELTMEDSEKLYGFGLQNNTFQQRGLRKEIRVNSWSTGNVGFSHAPVPFYVSTKGYGVLVNTSRYATFYCGTMHKASESINLKEGGNSNVASSTLDLYKPLEKSSDNMIIEVPSEKGMEIFVFEGPTTKEAIQRYNLYSGGGCMVPAWGLGVKYRGKGDYNDAKAVKLAKYFRENKIPCDMYGLEPGWHSVAYSCSFVWKPSLFPNPDQFIDRMDSMGYKLNLWEHAYVFPTSPLFDPLKDKSGNFAVWKGLVPDFVDPKAREIFGDYHEKTFINKGITAFKLDECDAADYKDAAAQWSFPELSQFPSGIDGEQMHQLFGVLYQKTLLNVFNRNNKRTLLDVRSSQAFAAPYPASLYSDMYDHHEFVRMISNAGFSGLLWSPEIRETKSDADLIRRTQSGVLSAQLLFNSWYLSNPPWLQYDYEKNNRDEFLPNAKELESQIRNLLELRMSLIPYLYSAFATYHFKGIPPFRALVVDYPQDSAVYKIDDQYMMGENLMAAPFLDGASKRSIYFPSGVWYDFNTNQKYEGGKAYNIEMSLDQIPLFVKEGTILPMAKPVQYVTPTTVFEITCHLYGKTCKPTLLFEDNSYTLDYQKNQFNWISLEWNGENGKVTKTGKYKVNGYKVTAWIKH
ncbi:MAG: glycoside hydrolase family 31 protein [Mariniphaga sp.]|nr:glycoside hydrolase family 31 protein [Mariniphaga sp.]